MKKLLGITDSEEFWKVFSEEREARRRQLRNLPFAKKIGMVEKMRAAQLRGEEIGYFVGCVERSSHSGGWDEKSGSIVSNNHEYVDIVP